jgi:hypothetical protein
MGRPTSCPLQALLRRFSFQPGFNPFPFQRTEIIDFMAAFDLHQKKNRLMLQSSLADLATVLVSLELLSHTETID